MQVPFLKKLQLKYLDVVFLYLLHHNFLQFFTILLITISAILYSSEVLRNSSFLIILSDEADFPANSISTSDSTQAFLQLLAEFQDLMAQDSVNIKVTSPEGSYVDIKITKNELFPQFSDITVSTTELNINNLTVETSSLQRWMQADFLKFAKSVNQEEWALIFQVWLFVFFTLYIFRTSVLSNFDPELRNMFGYEVWLFNILLYYPFNLIKYGSWLVFDIAKGLIFGFPKYWRYTWYITGFVLEFPYRPWVAQGKSFLWWAWYARPRRWEKPMEDE